jgi:hypothetical protein
MAYRVVSEAIAGEELLIAYADWLQDQDTMRLAFHRLPTPLPQVKGIAELFLPNH